MIFENLLDIKNKNFPVIIIGSGPAGISLALKLDELPSNFSLQRNVAKMMEARKEMATGKRPMDWGFGETMACAHEVRRW